ncbi:MAG: proprotein convertase P-domain-containing protein [Phycisphaeraceae bacterium]|nr:proprotein convertase P-domain-containing protein [Phycisphaeraceae bacterium]
MNRSLFAAALLAATGSAFAAPQESVTFLNVDSNACSGCSQNTVLTHTFTGGYAVGAVRIVGSLTEVNTGTFASEARILVTPPVGTPFVVQASVTTGWTGTLVVAEFVHPTNGGITDAAGTWSFRFYESFDDTADFLVDARWDTVTLTLDDQAEPTITTLTGPGNYTEVEPNDWTYVGNRIAAMAPGETITGNTTGTATVTPGATSSDNYLVTTTTAPAGIYKNQLAITTTGTAGHTGTIRGLVQALQEASTSFTLPGMIARYSDSYRTGQAQQTSATTTTPARMNQWYSFGKGETVEYRVTGGTATTADYVATFSRVAVSPTVVANTLTAGPVTIARGTGNTTTVDMWLYDSNFNAIANAGNEASNTLTRNLGPGTYYLAVSNANTANNQATPSDSATRTGIVLRTPDMIANSSTTVVANMNMAFTHGGGVEQATGTKAAAYDIAWYQFSVAAPVNPGGFGSATPSTVNVQATTKLAVQVTLADGSPNNITSVVVDATALGLSNAYALNDSGANGDVTANDGIWSADAVVALNAPALGAQSLPFTVTDAQSRTGNGTINVNIVDLITGTCCVAGVPQVSTRRNCELTLGGTYAGDGTGSYTGGTVVNSTDVPRTITDNATQTSTLTSTDAGTISRVQVEVRMNHTWVGDLNMSISNGTRTVTLFNRPGVGVAASTVGFNVDLLNTGFYVFGDGFANFWDAAQARVTPGNLPPGEFAPVANTADNTLSSLADFAGDPIAGTWTLTVSDGAGGDTGAIVEWRLRFNPVTPCTPTNPACNPADVATEGSAQPFIDGPDGFITGTDFDVFVQAFFQEVRRPEPSGPYIADLTNGDGSGGPDGFITGSDFDFFIVKFFEGCP